jgi:hypothetical protein
MFGVYMRFSMCVTSYAGILPMVFRHALKRGIKLAVLVTNGHNSYCKSWTKTDFIFLRLAFINVFHSQYVRSISYGLAVAGGLSL